MEGIQIQVYDAGICCLMLNTISGRMPNMWMVILMALYMQGLADVAGVLRELNRTDITGIMPRAQAEAWIKRFGK